MCKNETNEMNETNQINEINETTRIFGQKICRYLQVDSTNKIAFHLALRGEAEGTVVVADEQSKGEGRRGSWWFSPPGGLWLSLVLRPSLNFSQISLLNILGAVAVAETAQSFLTHRPVFIYWPNDVMIDKKKVGGVMCRFRAKKGKLIFVIMGIGVNLNVREFSLQLQKEATSLSLEEGHSISRDLFLDLLLRKLEELYTCSNGDWFPILKKARTLFPLLGKPVKLKTSQEEWLGYPVDIDESGGLIVRLESGMQRVIDSETSVNPIG